MAQPRWNPWQAPPARSTTSSPSDSACKMAPNRPDGPCPQDVGAAFAFLHAAPDQFGCPN
eukprot:12708169-Alexandrium_andersonii.AAC.1